MAADVNRHHNVPSSRGGSSRPCNLSTVKITRHNDFHEWARNRNPDTLVQQIAINSVGFNGSTLPPTALEDLFAISFREDWRELYWPEATATTEVTRRAFLRVADYTRMHFQEILLSGSRLMQRLENGEKMPPRGSGLLCDSMRFFEAENVQGALLGLLTETYSGHHSWVKPMRRQVRNELMDVLTAATPVSLTQSERPKVLDFVRRQNAAIANSISAWQPQGRIVSDFETRRASGT